MPNSRRDICVLGRTLGTTRSYSGDAGGRYVGVRLNDTGRAVFGEPTQRVLDLEGAALVLNLVAGTASIELIDNPEESAIDQIPSVRALEPDWIKILLADAS